MRRLNFIVGFVFFDKMKLAFDTVEALKDFFVVPKWRYSRLEVFFFCFILPNHLVLMNGQELNVCSLLTLNVNCFDSVAAAAVVSWQ